MHHIFGYSKHFGGGKADIQVIAVDAVHDRRKNIADLDVHILIVGQHGFAHSSPMLPFLAEHGLQHPHDSILLPGILLHGAAHRHLKHRVSQQPVILCRLPKIRQHDCVDSALLPQQHTVVGRTADNGGLAFKHPVIHLLKADVHITWFNAGVLQILSKCVEYAGPYGLIQSYRYIICLVFVRLAPVDAGRTH